MEDEYYNLAMIVLGIAILGVTWLPNLLKEQPLSYPIIYVVAGFLLYKVPVVKMPDPLPYLNSFVSIHLTEFCVIVSLAGVGLKVDSPLKWKNWKHLFQLLVVAMLLSIAMFSGLSFWYGGFSLAAAVLLGAVLAPTDPVLAADVQVGPPGEGDKKRDKFLLTAEAGFNDGLAFPFVYMAIALSIASYNYSDVLLDWLWQDLIYKIVMAVAAGVLLGFGFREIFWRFQKLKLTNVSDGFVSLALTLLVYGITEMLGGYGFLAVFIGALIFSKEGKHHTFKKELHNFTDQLERLLIVVILLLFGAILSAGLFDFLTVRGVIIGLVFVFVIRPVSGWLSLFGTTLTKRERMLVSFFGIRGIGSLYYLAYGISHGDFAEVVAMEIWAVAAFTILVSIIIHGILAYPATKWAQGGRVEIKTEADVR